MGTKIFATDSANGKMVFEKPKAEKTEKPEDYRLGITAPQASALLTIAYKDGFEADGDTEQGVKGQNTRAIQAYVRMAVDRFIQFRNSQNGETTPS